MTRTVMHRDFKLEIDKSTSLSTPAFESEEIDFWLNSAVMKFVKTRYSGVNMKRKGFEQDQKRIDDLRTLVVEDNVDPSTSGASKPNGWLVQLSGLSETYLLGLGEEVVLDITTDSADDILTTSNAIRQGVTEITSNEYRSHIDDPYSEHVLHNEKAKPLRLFLGDAIEFITDGRYDIETCHIRYIREPAVIGSAVDCDLADQTHPEIVKMAASMALENIEQPRYQSHMNEIATME